jgi:hypothetical protein
LIGVLLFFPTPIILVVVVAFMPAIFIFVFTTGIMGGMGNPLSWILGILVGLILFLFIAKIYYWLLCQLDKRIKHKMILWAFLGVLIFLTCTVRLYWFGAAGARSSAMNAIEIFKGVFNIR